MNKATHLKGRIDTRNSKLCIRIWSYPATNFQQEHYPILWNSTKFRKETIYFCDSTTFWKEYFPTTFWDSSTSEGNIYLNTFWKRTFERNVTLSSGTVPTFGKKHYPAIFWHSTKVGKQHYSAIFWDSTNFWQEHYPALF